MKYCFTFLLLCILSKTFGQQIIIGDSINKSVVRLNLLVPINSTVEIDLDCDGIKDIAFNSQQTNFPVPPNWPTSEAIFQTEIKAITTNLPGYKPEPATFNDKDNVNLKNANWNSPILSCGNGGMGPYGQTISNKTIVCRKTSLTDTAYFFVKLSFYPAHITIQEIISDCPAKVLSVIGADGKEKINEVLFYPNPFTDRLYASILNGATCDFYFTDLGGKLIRTFLHKTSGQLNTADLPSGPYVLRYSNGKTTKNVVLIKK